MVRKQIDRDVTLLMASVGRLTEQQLQLFFLLQSMVLSYKPDGFARLLDSDVALATGALAGSLETASKGVIFEEGTGSVVAEGLRRAMKPVLEEITRNHGSRAEREVAIVLRAMERGAKHDGGHIPEGETSYLDLANRVFQQRPSAGGASQPRLAGGEALEPAGGGQSQPRPAGGGQSQPRSVGGGQSEPRPAGGRAGDADKPLIVLP